MKAKIQLVFTSVLFLFILNNTNRATEPDHVSALLDTLKSLAAITDEGFSKIHFESMRDIILSKDKLSKADSALLKDYYNKLISETDSCGIGNIASYNKRCQTITIAWISPTDGQISYTWLSLPKDWDPAKEYPLYIGLHGLWDVAGDKIQYLVYPYQNESEGSIAYEDGINISPWGRGNLWYEGISETDIWECIDVIEKLFKINQKRKYITGHSMGGYGAWRIAGKSPDVWAGVGVHAGAVGYSTEPLHRHAWSLRNVPTYFVTGTNDGLLSVNNYAYYLLQIAGNENLSFVTFEGGHEYRQEDVERMYLWLRKFEKQEPLEMDIFGQVLPSGNPVNFAPDLVSKKGRNEYAPRLSYNLKDFYFSTEENNYKRLNTYSAHLQNGTWTEPDTAFFSKFMDNCTEAFPMADSTLYFLQRTGNNDNATTDFWVTVQDTAGKWSEPEKIDEIINQYDDQWYLSVSERKNLVFSTNGSIYFSTFNNETGYSAPMWMKHPARPDDLNSDVYIDPDEAFVIYSVKTREEDDRDLYISFNIINNGFSYPKKLPEPINTDNDEFAPYVTPDQKNLFFSRKQGEESDIYWVSTDFLDKLRFTNFKPYRLNTISDQNIKVGDNYKYTIPDSIFVDDDYWRVFFSARLANGEALPNWLRFNSSSLVFSGKPEETAEYEIVVTVTDSESDFISDTFRLTVEESLGIETTGLIKNSIQVYPNPVSNKLTIFCEAAEEYQLTIIDNLGRTVIQELVNDKTYLLDVSQLYHGIYFALIRDNQSHLVIDKIKLIKL